MYIGQIIQYKKDNRTTPEFWGAWCVILEVERDMFFYRTLGKNPVIHVRWVEDSNLDRFLYDW